MKSKLICLFATITAFISHAQSNAPTFIKGDMEIQYRTRSDVDSYGKPNVGVTDVYRLNLNVCNSALFSGQIDHTPSLLRDYTGLEKQGARLDYRVNLSVVNPKNPQQSKAVGNLTGTVPIDKKNVYRFSDGTMRIGVNAVGTARAFESTFRGQALGRPPKTTGLLDRLTSEAMSITRQVQGKPMTLVVTNYDKMVFNGHTLAMGPAEVYPEAQVNGEMVYDYERSAWYFRGVSVSYQDGSKTVTDRLSGNIRWIESPHRKTNGEGEYQFDVRVNEPEVKATEAAVFAAASDADAFFESNPAISSLLGTMKYKDSFSGDTVTSSKVTVDLQGSQLSRVQVMNLCKLILVSAIVPLNAE